MENVTKENIIGKALYELLEVFKEITINEE